MLTNEFSASTGRTAYRGKVGRIMRRARIRWSGMRYWVSAMLLASAMATPAFSQQAPQGDGGRGEGRGGHQDGGGRPDARGGPGRGGQPQQAAPQQQAPQPQAQPQQQRPQGGPGVQQGGRPGGQPPGGGFQRGGDRGQRPDGQPGFQGRPGGNVNGGGQPGQRGDNRRGGDDGRHYNRQQANGVRVWQGNRGGDNRGPDGRGWNGRDDRGRDQGRADNRGRPGGGGDWNRGWRQDRRYDWQSYRNSHREIYRGGGYRAPYGYSYGYRRFSPGFRIPPIFFAQDYWISNPDYYRLPPAYGEYRWVRYYNDALLIDIDDGEVVDVIPDFFY
jgi:Ni/Co efflux regulator RcnB